MAGLSCISSMIKASSPHTSPTSDSPPFLPSTPGTKLTKQQTRTRRSSNQNRNLQSEKQKQTNMPTIIRIERAIGAGSYRDAENEDLEQRNTIFDGVLPSGANKFESPPEKKLREISEVFVDRTEAGFRSSGKTILIFAFKWILPIWTFSLLVACGVIKLPFRIPFLDELIM